MDAPAGLRRRLELLLQGDLQHAHFSALLLWLRGEAPMDSLLREVGDFVAHPYRDRGPVSRQLAKMAEYLNENLGENLDSRSLVAKMEPMLIPAEQVFFEFREVLLSTGLLLDSEDELLAVVYEGLVLFSLTSMHLAQVSAPDGWRFPLYLGTHSNGSVGIFAQFIMGALDDRAYWVTIPVVTSNLPSVAWLDVLPPRGEQVIVAPLQYLAGRVTSL